MSNDKKISGQDKKLWLKKLCVTVCLVFVMVALKSPAFAATTRTVAIHPSGTAVPGGYDATYTSMSAMQAGENKDLVALDRFLRVEIVNSDGNWSTADTTAVTFDGWNTNRSAGQYVEIEVMSGARNPYTDGKWSTSHYRLSSASTTLIIDNDAASGDYFEADFIGLQVENTGSGNEAAIIRDGAYHKVIKFIGCHFRKTTTSDEVIHLTDNGTAEVWFINCILERTTNNDEIVRATSAWSATAYFYNCTVVGGGIEGLDVDTGTVTVKNCAVFNNDNTDILAGGVTPDFNASDDSVGTNWVNISPAAEVDGWNAAVTDYANGDYRVKDTNSVLYQAGLSQSLDSNVPSEDIAGNARPIGSNPVSIGAFDIPCGTNLVMVTGDGTTNGDADDAIKLALFQSWGWTVTAIDDGAVQATYDTAAANNDVMYIAESVGSGNVGTKATNLTIPVVVDEDRNWDEFGFASGGTFYETPGTDITILDNSHYITSPFSTGSLSVYSPATDIGSLDGTANFASGITVLATRVADQPSLFVADTGEQLIGLTAPARRVGFYTATGDANNFTSNTETLLKRSLGWAAGCGAGGGGTNNDPVLNSIGNKSVDEGQLLQFTISATDPDAGDTLTYSASNLPSGASFDPGTQTFSWTPNVGDAGSYPNVQFTVVDDGTPQGNDSELITITVFVSGGGGLPAPDLNEYSCNMKITVNNTKVSGSTAFTDFPVLISLTDDSLKNTGCSIVKDSNGYDIIFVDSTKTIQLYHEVEKYDGATGEFVSWVRIPTLSATSDTDIYLYYGNINVSSSQENPTDVWDSNYKGVWHLKEDAATVPPTTYEDRISNAADDSEERISSGAIDWGSSDLELGEEGSDPQEVGMRWRNILIPQGATITSAYIEFTIDEASTETPANLTFWGQDSDNAAVFENVAYNISDDPPRTKTSASVSWNNVPTWPSGTEGETRQSPDISPIIQEIVNRGGWASGNALVVIVTGSNTRTVESYDGVSGSAPLLHVEYTTTTDFHLDSTSNDNDGIPNGNTLTASGKIDGAQDFDGTNDIIEAPDNSTLEPANDITVSAWVNFDVLPSTRAEGAVLVRKRHSGSPWYSYTLEVLDTDELIFIWRNSSQTQYFAGHSSFSLSTGTWYHMVGVRDGGTIRFYINGSDSGTYTGSPTGTIYDSDEPLTLGASRSTGLRLDGILDEARVSSNARSADWIQTEYNNQSDPSTFYSVVKNCPASNPPISEYTCSLPITIDSTKVSGSTDLINFPVLISLTNVALKTTGNCGYVQNSNGYDIIFSDSTETTQLDHEMVSYDGAAGKLVAWVRIPTLDYNDDTVINLHFGHASVCGPTENPAGVWDSSYAAVWHLEEDPGGTAPQMQDSTSNNNHATSQGGMSAASNQIAGQLGNGIDLDGVDDYFTAPHSSSLDITGNQVTLEAWARIPVGGSAQDSPFIMKADSGNQERYMLGVDGGPDPAPINHRVTTASGHFRYDTGSMITGTWEHVVMVYDGSLGSDPRFFIYMDGNLVSSSNASGNILTASTGVQLGKRVDARWYDGDFDELRISNVARSADWIKTSYNNQSDPSSFYSVGSSSCFLGGFSCNRKITIPKENVSGSSDLSNFPVLIKTDNDCKLRHTGIGGSVQNINGWDIIFTDSGGSTQLDHELVSYDDVTGELVAWVKIPTLSATSDTDIYMYYGNSAMTCDPSNPTGVWDSNYKGVWHLDETSGTHYDSTSNDNDGTAQGGVTQNATGKIGGADNFDGVDDRISIPNSNSLNLNGTNDVTMEAWIYNSGASSETWHAIVSKGTGQQYAITFNEPSNYMHFETSQLSGGTCGALNTSSDTVSSNAWHHIVGTYDGANKRIYIDGIQSASAGCTYNFADNTEVLEIGRDGNSEEFLGIIDEVRVSDVARSADWIKTSYDNQRDPSSFFNMSEDSCGGAYGFQYNYCKKITVDNTQVIGSTDFSAFPLLVNITSNDLRSVANGGRVESDQGDDIVFKTSSCGLLDHEIDKYEPTTGQFVAWVRIPTLSYNSDTEVYMYYGDSSVDCPTENPTAVWDASYAAVWHLTEDPSGTAPQTLDSTANDNDGTSNGSMTTADLVSGKIGEGIDFDGSNDWIESPNSGSLDITGNQITLSAWVKSTADQNDDAGIINKSYSADYNYMLNVQSSDQGNFRVRTGGTSTYLTGATTLQQDQWYFLYGIYDGTTAKVYLNGSEDGTDSRTGNIESSGAAPVALGRRRVYPTVDDRFFAGVIDEVHISNVSRSTDWMQTEYNNQNDPGNFYTVGSCFEQTMTQTNAWEESFQ